MAAYMHNNVGKRTRVVAWLNQEEWQYVYDNFYSDDCELQKKALDRFAAWKSRVTTKMPLSIACTARLVEACVLEKQGGNKESIRLGYAIALIRFVNMMTDRYQNKFFTQPIHIIAQEIGIPVWIVNLRHDATHADLPSLSMLKTGVVFALSWLQTNYWEKNEDMDSSESELDARVQLRQLLIRYQQEQYMILQMGWSQTNEAIVEVLVDIAEILENDTARQYIFEILLHDGFLIPTEQQVQSLAINTDLDANTTKVPEIFVNVWQPLLQKLSQMKILYCILEPLCKELCKFKTPMMQSAMYLSGWMQLFLESAGKNLGGGVGSSCHGLVISSSKVDWRRLFNLCVESPNPYTCHIVQRLVDYLKPPLTPDVKANVIELAVIYLNQFNVQEDIEMTDREQIQEKEKDEPIIYRSSWQPFSIDKIQTQSFQSCTSVSNKVQLNEGERLRSADVHCEAWERSKANVSWSEYPLGWLPGQLSQPEYLLLKSNARKHKEGCEEENNNKVSYELGSSTTDYHQTTHSSFIATAEDIIRPIQISSPPSMTIY